MERVALGEESAPSARVLSYDQSLSADGFRCISASAGLTCESETTGRGFFIHRDGYELFAG